MEGPTTNVEGSALNRRKQPGGSHEALMTQMLCEGPYAARRFPAGTPYRLLRSEYDRTIGAEVATVPVLVPLP